MDHSNDPPVPARKFQTRRGVQRTSKADREAFAQAEERRQAEVQREDARVAAAAAARGTYAPRGRGALVGTSTERTRNESGGGVFGAAVPVLGGTGRGRGASRGRGRGGNLDGLIGVKEEVPVVGEGTGEETGGLEGEAEQSKAGAGVRKAPTGVGERKSATTRAKPATERKKPLKPTKKDGPVMLSSDEEGLAVEGPRRDIETIEISSDDEEAADNRDENEGPVSARAKGKRRENQSQAPRAKIALRPVRAPREARGTDELSAFSSRKKMQRSVRDRDKAYRGEDHFRGVPVDDDDHDVIDVDEAGPFTDFSLRGLESQTKSSRRKGPSTKDKEPKFASETIEERAERLRHADDVRKIGHEFAAMPPVVALTSDVEMTEPGRLDQEMASEREGKIYLFQFPPLTPLLVDPSHKDDMVEIKQEPGAEGTKQNGAIGTAAAAARGGDPSKSGNKGKDKAQPQIKKEEHDSKEDAKAQIASAAERAKILTADGARLPPGFAGTLNVHKSGKVTLEWGETNMEVRWGSEVDFLQDVVLATGDEREDVTIGDERRAYALGQVQKKLVVIPDWQKIYE